MRPRLAALVTALAVPALPLLAPSAAHAAPGTICVGAVPSGTVCSSTAASIPDAITAAQSGDTIRPASGTYTDGPYTLPAGVNLRGFGAGISAAATKLTKTGAAGAFLTVNGGTVADLRIELPTAAAATGLSAEPGSTVDNVVVVLDGASNSNGLQAQGSQIHDATVNVINGGTGNTGIRSLGGNLLYSESTWTGGAVAYRQISGTDNVSRITIRGALTAMSVEGGTLNVDDSVIELGTTGQTGIQAAPAGGQDTAIVNGNHLTVVGAGAGGSRGVAADANGAGTLTATVNLQNSIVRGPATSLVRSAGVGHTANLTATRSNYQTVSAAAPTDGGGNLVGADPLFINPANDFHLRAGSPVVDKAAASTASIDRDRQGRSFDGDRDGTATPDMGAYELRDVTAPKTTFNAGPNGPTNDNTPVFQFSSEKGATFECSLDGGGFQACSSPATTPPLSEGAHSLSVRAVDAVFNVENPPVSRSFTVDTIAPDVTITKKPGKRFFKKKVKFKFASSDPTAKFQCQLDGKGWKGCNATWKFNTKVGKHTLLVRAVDAAGNIDQSPARYKFKRLKRGR